MWAITSNSTTTLQSTDNFWHWAFMQYHFFYWATENFLSSRHKSLQKWCWLVVTIHFRVCCFVLWPLVFNIAARKSISLTSQILLSLITTTTTNSSLLSSITCLLKQTVSATVGLGSHAISPKCCNRFSAVYSCLRYCDTKSMNV